MADHAAQSTVRGTTRKKAVEACERCRSKRIKCNGLQPCEQCSKRKLQCHFAIAPLPTPGGNDALAEKLDLILGRLENIEQRLDEQSSSDSLDAAPRTRSTVTAKPQLLALHPQTRGIVKLNQQTGCFEYYGRTSTFQIASALGKRFEERDEASLESATSKKRCLDLAESPPESPSMMPKTLDLDELTSFCDYIIPPHALRGNRRLQVHIADRHLENFFRTIHIFLPMLDKSRFKHKYNSLRKDFGDKRLVFATTEDPNRPQFVCLLYAILALGALYEDDQDDSSMWASWYFAEAQNMLGRLLDASNLELTQAATFLGAYAQHAIKPNLAYNLNGIAARLAYSIGLTVDSMHRSLGFDKEEAKRTWAIIYIQEVEISLDAGRPMSIRSSDMDMNYPTVQLPATDQSRTDAAQVVFITHLANISKIVKNILKLSGVHEERPILLLEERESLRQQLDRWHDSLPNYLSIESSNSTENDTYKDEASFLHDWRARQQSSLRIHYNLALIMLLRNSLHIQKEIDPSATDCPLMALHRKVCMDAARDMITHIHQSFSVAPGLRRWSYYCFYCLQATLVLLPQTADSMASDEALCRRAVEVFEQIKLKASQRCAEVVRQYLRRRAALRPKRQKLDEEQVDGDAVEVAGPAPPLQHTEHPHPVDQIPTEIGQDLDRALANGHEYDANANPDSVFGFDDGTASWPSISPNTLQTEMYGALYSVDASDNFYLGYQPFLFGGENLTNDVPVNDAGEWPPLWNPV